MNCTELIDLFHKVGGKLHCDYYKNIVKVDNTLLKCDIKSTDYKKLEYLTWTFANSPYSMEHLVNKNISNNDIINSNIQFKNRYLKNNEYGFEIIYL